MLRSDTFLTNRRSGTQPHHSCTTIHPECDWLARGLHGGKLPALSCGRRVSRGRLHWFFTPVAALKKSSVGAAANRPSGPLNCYARRISHSIRKDRCNIERQRFSQAVSHARSWQAHLQCTQRRSATALASDPSAGHFVSLTKQSAAPMRLEQS